jgi:general secretion pathway protein L
LRLPTLGQKLIDLLNRLGRWWLAEWRELLPDSLVGWFKGPGRKILLLGAGQQSLKVVLLDEGRQVLASADIDRSKPPDGFLDDLLREARIDRAGIDVVLQLAPDKIFHRTLTLPSQAQGSIAAIVTQDLARKTPFRPSEIYHGYAVAQALERDKILVRQWVARREFVNDAIAPFPLEPDQIWALCAGSGAETEIPSNFMPLRIEQPKPISRIRRSVLILSVSACILALVLGGLRYMRQEAVLEELTSQIATTRIKAQHMRLAVDKVGEVERALMQLRSLRRDLPGLLDLWDEVTRVLPSHSWLIELRLSDTPGRPEPQINLVGFSAAATSLVGLVEQSALFADTSLTAPVAMDLVEGRERFALQAKVRRMTPVTEATR